jgi:hypothetical protein
MLSAFGFRRREGKEERRQRGERARRREGEEERGRGGERARRRGGKDNCVTVPRLIQHGAHHGPEDTLGDKLPPSWACIRVSFRLAA